MSDDMVDNFACLIFLYCGVPKDTLKEAPSRAVSETALATVESSVSVNNKYECPLLN